MGPVLRGLVVGSHWVVWDAGVSDASSLVAPPAPGDGGGVWGVREIIWRDPQAAASSSSAGRLLRWDVENVENVEKYCKVERVVEPLPP